MYLCIVNSGTGKWIVLIGAVIMLIGFIIWLFSDKLQWFGKLPGDIAIERENFRFYFPITTMILLSVLISGIIALVRKFF